MRTGRLVPLVAALCLAAFGLGLYAGSKWTRLAPKLKALIAEPPRPAAEKDAFGRLLSYPGKIEIACPPQDRTTAVLLVIGQSNAANYQGQRHESADDRVVNFSEGRCYRAASPLLGADGEMGESWTLLGAKLIQSGLYRTVVLVPAAVGGSAIRRWAAGGDLNAMMAATIKAARTRYAVTAVLVNQGPADFALGTPEETYRSDFESLIGAIRAQGVSAPVFITRASCGANGPEDNPIARAQASLADSRRAIFDGPNTDHELTRLDRYDGGHYGASGQEKYTDAWIRLFRATPGL